MNRAELIGAAKAHAAGMAENYAAPDRALIPVAGRSGYLGIVNGVRAMQNLGQATEADLAVAEALAFALTGGDTAEPVLDEAGMMRLERERCLELARLPATEARIVHMLETGKPLRN